MFEYWVWWVLAAVLIGVELTIGTFYLLAVGFAFIVGGVVAWFGASASLQLAVGGALSVVGVVIAHQWRLRRALPPPQASLDLGQTVRVQTWREDGSARVDYRGTQWDAEVVDPQGARHETMVIVGTRGSTLLIAEQHP